MTFQGFKLNGNDSTTGVFTVTDNNVSIDNPQTKGEKTYSVDGKLHIQENTLNKDIYVFNAMGVLIKFSAERDIEISGLNVNSVYIVKAGNAAATVIIRQSASDD
ncbi:hypothetical protein LJB95_02140 [Paludibacteraceae bacterium OttesenSCG-928-F17]|nr:hypothetical protein [Paludibacteraceae bacterium OttesenSCG-928-F17]